MEKVSINHADKINRMLTLYAGALMVPWSFCEQTS